MGNAISRTDAGFGPLLSGEQSFASLFEEPVFTTAPAGIAIIAAILRVLSILGEEHIVDFGALLWTKVTLGTTLAGVHISSVMLWIVIPETNMDLTPPAASLAIASSVCVLVLLFIEHLYSYRSSMFLSLYLSVTFILDVAKTYSCYHRVGFGPLCSLYMLGSVTRLLLLASQEISKRHLIRDEELRSTIDRESVSGFWSRSLFVWVNSTLLLGFRQALSIDDLPPLAPEFRAKTVFAAFNKQWEKVNKRSKYALAKACLLAQAVPFSSAMIPRLCQTGFIFAQPFLIMRMTKAVQQDGMRSSDTSGLVSATALIYFGIAITKGYSNHLSYQVTTCLQGMLRTAIYDKMLRVSYDQLSESTAITLMSADLIGLETIVPVFHDALISILEVGLGISILASILGDACLLVAVPACITTLATGILTKRMSKARAAWTNAIEDRVAKTSNIIAQMKLLKMAGLSQPAADMVQRLRATEIDISMSERNLRVCVGGVGAFQKVVPQVLVMAGAMFGTRLHDAMTPTEIYTTLSVVAIVAEPLFTLLTTIPVMSNAISSFPRIQRFLCQAEHADQRSTPSDAGVRMANVSINVSGATSLLQDINLTVETGDVAMISGPVGCGKSTLLKSVVGEMEIEAGVIEVSSVPVGYSDQVAWLENTSIRDNICHGDRDETWFRQVITACALDQDIETLPHGDQTIVGTNASSISAGQKQRVSLARAVYCRAEVVVLDDPLSSVDEKTSATILKRLLGEDGLLRSRNVTVIMTSSSGDDSSVANVVFKMSADGTVQRLPGLAKDARRRGIPRGLVTAHQDNRQHWGGESHVSRSPKAPKTCKGRLGIQGTLEDDDEAIRRGDRSLYTYYLTSATSAFALVFLCATSASSVAERLPAIYIRIWQQKEPLDDEYFVGYACLAALKVLISTVSLTIFFRTIVAKSSIELHRRLLTAVISSTLGFLSEADIGFILNRFSEDMSIIGQKLPIMFLNSVYSCVAILLDMVTITAGASHTTAMMPILFFVIYVVQRFYLRTSRQLQVRELEGKALVTTKFTETARGIQHIRAFKWQKAYMENLQALLDYAHRPAYISLCVQRWLTLVTDLCVCGIATTLVSKALKRPEETSEHAVGLAMLTLTMFSENLSHLVDSTAGLEMSLGAVARVKRFILETPHEEDADCDSDIPDHWPSSGNIQFRGVSASYRRMDGTSHQVLNNISFTIGHGKKLGLSGRTGCGKSTILAVLLRMIDYSGSIIVDGRELRTVPREIVRSRILSLIQDGIQLQGTVRLNVDPYDPDDVESGNRLVDQTLIEALTRVGLWATVLAGGGLEAELADLNLSQGQLQLLGIARAIVRRDYLLPKIVLIDEATSNTDNDTDRKLQTLFAEVFKHSTIIMISHRLYAFDKMHKVLMLDEGQIEDVLNRDPTSGLLVDR